MTSISKVLRTLGRNFCETRRPLRHGRLRCESNFSPKSSQSRTYQTKNDTQSSVKRKRLVEIPRLKSVYKPSAELLWIEHIPIKSKITIWLSGCRVSKLSLSTEQIATHNIKSLHDIIYLKPYKRKKIIEIKNLERAQFYCQKFSFSLTSATILMPSRSQTPVFTPVWKEYIDKSVNHRPA